MVSLEYAGQRLGLDGREGSKSWSDVMHYESNAQKRQRVLNPLRIVKVESAIYLISLKDSFPQPQILSEAFRSYLIKFHGLRRKSKENIENNRVVTRFYRQNLDQDDGGTGGAGAMSAAGMLLQHG